MAKHALADLFAIIQQPALTESKLEKMIFEEESDEALRLLMRDDSSDDKVAQLRELIKENNVQSISKLEGLRKDLLIERKSAELFEEYGVDHNHMEWRDDLEDSLKIRQIDAMMQSVFQQMDEHEDEKEVEALRQLYFLCAEFSVYLQQAASPFPRVNELLHGCETGSTYAGRVGLIYQALDLLDGFLAIELGENHSVSVVNDLRHCANEFFKNPENLEQPNRVQQFEQRCFNIYKDAASQNPVLKEPAIFVVANVLWLSIGWALCLAPLIKLAATGEMAFRSEAHEMKQTLFQALPTAKGCDSFNDDTVCSLIAT